MKLLKGVGISIVHGQALPFILIDHFNYYRPHIYCVMSGDHQWCINVGNERLITYNQERLRDIYIYIGKRKKQKKTRINNAWWAGGRCTFDLHTALKLRNLFPVIFVCLHEKRFLVGGFNWLSREESRLLVVINDLSHTKEQYSTIYMSA